MKRRANKESLKTEQVENSFMVEGTIEVRVYSNWGLEYTKVREKLETELFGIT